MTTVTTSLLYLQENPVLFYFLIGFFGLCVGSFLNVVIYRLPIMLEHKWQSQLAYASNEIPPTQPQSINLFFPKSHCPQCNFSIPWWGNIPVMSYILLHRKCHYCKHTIPFRYPIIELLCMTLSLFTVYHFGLTWQAATTLLFIWSLIALFFIDIDHKILPDDITLPMIWVGLIVNTFHIYTTPTQSIFGAIFAYTSLWLVAFVFKHLRGIDGMGQGDFKLLAMMGAWLGWQLLPLIIILSSATGACFGIYKIIFQDRHFSEPLPFGPFLSIAGVVALFYGHDIMRWYLQIIT